MVDQKTRLNNPVGPVLEAGAAGRAVIAAIQQLNQDVVIQDRGSYYRVLVPGRCRVTREAIEKTLGSSFQLPGDLELIMPAFKGLLSMSDQEAVWRVGETP